MNDIKDILFGLIVGIVVGGTICFFFFGSYVESQANKGFGVNDSLAQYLLQCYDESPYEQTYEYLFNRVDNNPSHIIRTNYYGREYFTIPVHTDCGINDYVLIQQECVINRDYAKSELNETEKKE